MEKALVAQAVSSAMIETYCDETEKEIAQINEIKDLNPVSRFSPGYGDFDISFQKDFLKILNGSRIGLSLTDAFMLTPVKSVTAVIGFSEEKKEMAGKCVLCADKGCSFREAM
jgi:cobalamin-dependent methionine synthase I